VLAAAKNGIRGIANGSGAEAKGLARTVRLTNHPEKTLMDNEAIHKLPDTQPDPRVQLAFERTFLAYERTRIA
jgi:uncharacterized membrane protein YidH (DUF202 family)